MKLINCVELINPDIADISDVFDLYIDGATMRPDQLRGSVGIGDVVPPGWSIRDAALVEMCRNGAGIDAALAVSNVHARAVALDQCGGWNKVLGKPIQRDDEGALYSVEWLETRILELTCPSTGQVYHLHVPAEMATATEARDWVNHGIRTDVRS